MYRLFSKQNLRSKDVHLQGVLWETTDFICSSSSCGRVTNGYGNYVSKLKERVDKLEAQIAALLPAVTVPPMLEGTWLITQPNGRSYTVHSSAKASIARKCGYTVEEIRRTAESAPGQSNQCKNTGNQA
jgi:hypothetical protein